MGGGGRKGSQFGEIFGKNSEEFEDAEIFRLTGCSVKVFPSLT